MSWQRFFRFSMVGMPGTAVQLLAVAFFSRLSTGHYLAATAAALELSLVHNFIWHERYTWRDRDVSNSRGLRLLRFHLANGLISLTRNLLLVGLFVRTGMNVTVANLAAIGLCAGLNYRIGNKWVFACPGCPAGYSQSHAHTPDDGWFTCCLDFLHRLSQSPANRRDLDCENARGSVSLAYVHLPCGRNDVAIEPRCGGSGYERQQRARRLDSDDRWHQGEVRRSDG